MSKHGITLQAHLCSACDQVHLVFRDANGNGFEICLSGDETDALVQQLILSRLTQLSREASDPIGYCQGIA
jgi:hypothetical protein